MSGDASTSGTEAASALIRYVRECHGGDYNLYATFISALRKIMSIPTQADTQLEFNQMMKLARSDAHSRGITLFPYESAVNCALQTFASSGKDSEHKQLTLLYVEWRCHFQPHQ